MKRITLWALSTVSVLVLLFGYHSSTSGPLATSQTSAQAGAFSASSTATPGQAATTGSSGTTGGSGTSGKTKSSSTTVTGDVAQTEWGPVQVQLIVAGDSITNVSVLQYPSGNGRDQEINDYALPILTQETIDAQSATIDMVSGATVTSGGYVQSLQSALDQAGL
jgi:uncharacterized protein with FMN-binding domain